MSSDLLGLPEALADRAHAHLGGDAAALLRGDPWELLRVPGVTPAQADAFARDVLTDPDPQDPRRGRALVAHLLAEAARRGDTALPGAEVVAALRGLRIADPFAAVNAALDEARVMLFLEEPDVPDDAEELPDPEEWLALARYGLAEETVAEGVQRLSATAPPLEASADGEAARQALFHGVSVVTGPPDGVLAELAATGVPLAVAAVTATAAAEYPGAVSLHRLLEAREGHGGLGYARGEQWPLDAALVAVVGAEALDVEAAAALVEACPDGAHLVLFGDVDGLASLRPGRVLADLVASGAVPVTAVAPSSGPLSELVSGVRGGGLPVVAAPDREVVVVPVKDGAEAAHRAGQLLTDSIPRALGIPSDSVQVLTPGLAGTAAFNASLKAVVNPGAGVCGGFDVGDRVLVAVPLEGAPAGETGTVTEADASGLTVAFVDGKVRVPRALVARLRHGWAIPVQQAAGTRWPAVVAVFPSASGLSGALLLTALTRARTHLSIVTAAGPGLTRAAADRTPPARRTRLVGLLT
ncbi:ATP-dependent RecD-like DNA helicase [Actinocorallia sp. API 0066]|uniref:ATP-dependent DNA helicase n=1 Tax=Actinocorallia sp. API 0066 TaxID=2896846 RepID=UPI001E50872C|nr:ATP-dependent RecD-like DNA helicase [Actinocorallia sp. API 0066]MCD0450149.1 ATP-dependent RecD-like DNA helicase [Actinocorallia sp. API 0066]